MIWFHNVKFMGYDHWLHQPCGETICDEVIPKCQEELRKEHMLISPLNTKRKLVPSISKAYGNWYIFFVSIEGGDSSPNYIQYM